MPEMMKAAVLYEPHDLRIEELEQPECGPGEVKIQVIYNGLCGTDATEFTKGPMMVPLHHPHPGSGHVGPTVLGHEFIGRVVETGEGAQHLLGKRIACGAGVACGQCKMCQVGRTNLCDSYYTLGLSTDGGLAEYVVAPANICFEIPESCSDEDAGLAQPLAVALHSVNRAEIRPGQQIALLGFGAIGAFILAALSNHDGEVIALDVDPDRLELAKKLGASSTVLLGRDESTESIRSLFPEGIEVVFETSGVYGGAARAIALAALGGKVVLVGLNKTPQELILSDLVLREINLVTTVAHVCSTDIPAALELLASRSLSGLLMERVIPLSVVVDQGFEPLAAGKATGKILVDPRL